MTAADQQPNSRPFSLAEYLLLLSIDSAGRFRLSERQLNFGLAGATLADLARRGRINVTQDTVSITENPQAVLDEGDAPQKWHRDGSGLETPLDRVLTLIQEAPHEQDAEQWLNRFGIDQLREAYLTELSARGALAMKQTKMLGLFRRTKYEKNENFFEVDLQVRLGAVLSGDAAPDLVTWPLISLMYVTGLLERVFAEARAKDVREVLAVNVETLTAQQRSVYEALHAVQNVIAEELTATRGGPSGMNA